MEVTPRISLCSIMCFFFFINGNNMPINCVQYHNTSPAGYLDIASARPTRALAFAISSRRTAISRATTAS